MRAFIGMTLSLSIAASACGPATVTTSPSNAPNANTYLASRYEFLYKHSPSGDPSEIIGKLPFQEVSLSRGPCFGSCPVYKIVLRPLRSEFIGEAGSSRLGRYVGVVNVMDYARLCYLLESVDFVGMKPSYSSDVTDQATVSIAVKFSLPGKEPVTIQDYGEAGPIQLWAIESAIEDIAHRIEWVSE